MALGSTQPLTEMSTRRAFPGGKSGRCVRLTTYLHPVLLSRNLGALTSWNPLGLSRPVMGLLYFFRRGVDDGKVGDAMRYCLVVWGFKEVVPGGKRYLCTERGMSCHVVSSKFINWESFAYIEKHLFVTYLALAMIASVGNRIESR